MQIAKWGNSLAIRIPADFVRRHDLKEGDSIDLIEDEAGTVRLVTRQHWMDEIVRLSRPLPDGWKNWRNDRDDELAERRVRPR